MLPRSAPALFLALALSIGSAAAGEKSAKSVSPVASAKSPSTLKLEELAPAVNDDPRWQFTAGAQWRQIGRLNFRNGDSRASSFLSLPQRSLYEEDEEGYYTNGYVLQDSANSGQTWNWGYDDASQLQGDTLSFSGVTNRFDEAVEVERMNTDWSDDLAAVGGFAELESPVLWRGKRFAVSAVGNYSFVQDSSSNKATAFKATHEINEVNEFYTDAYDVSNLGVVPGAGHQGTFHGPGPLLNMNPQRLNEHKKSFHSYESFASELEQEFDLKLHTLSLGPRVAMNLGRIQAQVGLGFAGNVADWEARSKETLIADGNNVIRTWEDRNGGTAFLPGAYGELGLRWEFVRNWSINATARYDYAKSLEADVGAAAVDLDLKGVTGRVGVGWNF